MKTILGIVLFLMLTTLSFSDSVDDKSKNELVNDKSDAYYRKTLVGTWKITIKRDDGIEINTVDTFLANGNIIQKGIMKTPGGIIINVEAKCTWEIRNGIVFSILKSISPEGLIPLGSTFQDKIISMDANEFKYKNEDGKIYTYKKIIKKDDKKDLLKPIPSDK